MKPYPLSGLNHFTVPVVIEAILRVVEKSGAHPWDADVASMF
jgi:hypothetical protein